MAALLDAALGAATSSAAYAAALATGTATSSPSMVAEAYTVDRVWPHAARQVAAADAMLRRLQAWQTTIGGLTAYFDGTTPLAASTYRLRGVLTRPPAAWPFLLVAPRARAR